MSYDSREKYHQMMRRKEREAAIWQQLHPAPEDVNLSEAIGKMLYPDYYKDEGTEK